MERATAVGFVSTARSRAKVYGREDDALVTPEELLAIAGPCHYCGGEAGGWDHVIPLIRGGANTIDNLVPCCKACNRAKYLRTPEEWAAGKPGNRTQPERTDQPPLLTIREAATLVGISRSGMYDLVVNKGRIPHIRFGPRLIRVRRRAVDEWMSQAETTVRT